jgi:hypothetical protein
VDVDVSNARASSLKVLAFLLQMDLRRCIIHAYLVAYISIIWMAILIPSVKHVTTPSLKRSESPNLTSAISTIGIARNLGYV